MTFSICQAFPCQSLLAARSSVSAQHSLAEVWMPLFWDAKEKSTAQHFSQARRPFFLLSANVHHLASFCTHFSKLTSPLLAVGLGETIVWWIFHWACSFIVYKSLISKCDFRQAQRYLLLTGFCFYWEVTLTSVVKKKKSLLISMLCL